MRTRPNNDLVVNPNYEFFRFKKSSPVVQAIQRSRFVIKEKGSCENSGDLSTKFEIGADICFSVERLTNINPLFLKQELIAVLLHEIAHQFGTNEKEATHFQKMVAARLKGQDLWWAAMRMIVDSNDINRHRVFYSGVAASLLKNNELFNERYMSNACIWLKYDNPSRNILKFHQVNKLEEISLHDDVPKALENILLHRHFDDGDNNAILKAYGQCILYNFQSFLQEVDNETRNSPQVQPTESVRDSYNSAQ